MSQKLDQATQTMIQNLEKNTGKSLAQWVKVARASKLSKHKEVLNHLKSDHGLTHGYANLVALNALADSAKGYAPGQEDIEAQYAGEKAALRPIYDALIAAATRLGPDVEVAPKKANVSLRRNKQFALIQPSTKTRLDVGLVLKSVKPAGRLESAGSFNAMMTHRVRVESAKDVDRELLGWLKSAYDAA